MDILLKLDTVRLDSESTHDNETSSEIRTRVMATHDIQFTRYGSKVHNARVSNERLLQFCQLMEEQQKMLRQWASEYNWSTRVQMKILRLARTISDLSGDEDITNESIWEAVTMRRTNTLLGDKRMA